MYATIEQMCGKLSSVPLVKYLLSGEVESHSGHLSISLNSFVFERQGFA